MVTWINTALLRGALLLGCAVGVAMPVLSAPFPPDQVEFFEKSVRPLLAERCHSCHGVTKHQNGLRLDSRDAVMRGSDYGKVVEPGNPSASKLLQAVRRQPGVEAMPKKGDPLSPAQIAALEKWISLGLPWPEERPVATGAHAKPAADQHWAFQPVRKSSEPGLRAAKHGIDEIVGRKLKAAGLDFAPPADPAALCKRIHVTLTGLVPDYDEVRRFVSECGTSADRAREAAAALAERLLASPRYGERWARHWLDVARYSDTEGYTAGGKDNRYPYAWTYRDWVIRALNEDMPYDRFITLQLAADKAPGISAGGHPDLAALGFLTVNDAYLGDRILQTDDRIDVVTRGLLGLTVGCARCHDHKYDPIPGKDYYALYSVFNSSMEPDVLPVIGEAPDKVAAARFKEKLARRFSMTRGRRTASPNIWPSPTSTARWRTRPFAARRARPSCATVWRIAGGTFSIVMRSTRSPIP